MSGKHFMRRREFLVTSAGMVAAGLGSACGRAASLEEIQEAAAKVGRLPRRKLGYSRREVSVLFGAGTWAPEAAEAGILCGINFWHKADQWRGDTPRAILKDRDAYYCQVCVDRVRGNHETGVLDEEAHFEFVKAAARETGLRYFDDMQFHYGYHHVAELKSNRALIRAFERLKKAGLVRHLCLSQHSYNGNRIVPGGESAPVILTAVMQDGVYEHAQFAFTYGDNEAINRFVESAKPHGFGTTAMKTMGGAGRMSKDRGLMKNFPPGTTPPHALARWLTTQAPVDTAIIQINDLEDFVDTYSAAGKALRASDHQAIEQLGAFANREVCRLCHECLSHCQSGIPIADILRFERYAQDYGELDRAQQLYARLDTQGDACIVCGSCLPHCPQGLRIPERLAQAHELLRRPKRDVCAT